MILSVLGLVALPALVNGNASVHGRLHRGQNHGYRRAGRRGYKKHHKKGYKGYAESAVAGTYTDAANTYPDAAGTYTDTYTDATGGAADYADPATGATYVDPAAGADGTYQDPASEEHTAVGPATYDTDLPPDVATAVEDMNDEDKQIHYVEEAAEMSQDPAEECFKYCDEYMKDDPTCYETCGNMEKDEHENGEDETWMCIEASCGPVDSHESVLGKCFASEDCKHQAMNDEARMTCIEADFKGCHVDLAPLFQCYMSHCFKEEHDEEHHEEHHHEPEETCVELQAGSPCDFETWYCNGWCESKCPEDHDHHHECEEVNGEWMCEELCIPKNCPDGYTGMWSHEGPSCVEGYQLQAQETKPWDWTQGNWCGEVYPGFDQRWNEEIQSEECVKYGECEGSAKVWGPMGPGCTTNFSHMHCAGEERHVQMSEHEWMPVCIEGGDVLECASGKIPMHNDHGIVCVSGYLIKAMEVKPWDGAAPCWEQMPGWDSRWNEDIKGEECVKYQECNFGEAKIWGPEGKVGCTGEYTKLECDGEQQHIQVSEWEWKPVCVHRGAPAAHVAPMKTFMKHEHHEHSEEGKEDETEKCLMDHCPSFEMCMGDDMCKPFLNEDDAKACMTSDCKAYPEMLHKAVTCYVQNCAE